MLAPQLRTTRAVDEILVRTHRGRKRVIYRLSPRTAGAKGTYLSSLAERTLFTTPAEHSRRIATRGASGRACSTGLRPRLVSVA